MREGLCIGKEKWWWLIEFFLSFVLYLNNVKNSHLSSFGVSWFFFYLKILPWWWSSSSPPPSLSTSLTHCNYTRTMPRLSTITPLISFYTLSVSFFFFCIYIRSSKDRMNEQLTVGGQYSFNLISLKLRIEDGNVSLLLLFLLFACSFVWTIDASMCINEDFFIWFCYSSSYVIWIHSFILDVLFLFDLFINVICTMKFIDILVLFFYLNTIGKCKDEFRRLFSSLYLFQMLYHKFVYDHRLLSSPPHRKHV